VVILRLRRKVITSPPAGRLAASWITRAAGVMFQDIKHHFDDVLKVGGKGK
jgi:hypothetical protein